MEENINVSTRNYHAPSWTGDNQRQFEHQVEQRQVNHIRRLTHSSKSITTGSLGTHVDKTFHALKKLNMTTQIIIKLMSR